MNSTHRFRARAAPAVRAWAGDRSPVAATTSSPSRAVPTVPELSTRISSSCSRVCSDTSAEAASPAAATSPANGITTLISGRLTGGSPPDGAFDRVASAPELVRMRIADEPQQPWDRRQSGGAGDQANRPAGGEQQVAGDRDRPHHRGPPGEPPPFEAHPER